MGKMRQGDQVFAFASLFCKVKKVSGNILIPLNSDEISLGYPVNNHLSAKYGATIFWEL